MTNKIELIRFYNVFAMVTLMKMVLRLLEELRSTLKQPKVLKSSLDPGLSMQWPINVMVVDEGN